jgi:hypothetical protein
MKGKIPTERKYRHCYCPRWVMERSGGEGTKIAEIIVIHKSTCC